MSRKAVDPTKRFTDRAQDYVLARPPYPAAVLARLREAGALPDTATVADIGSGTGISSELFLAAGHEVYGVEPNASMRQAAEQRLGPAYPAFHSVAGKAEATTLPDASVDLVVAAQALHWFDIDACRREFLRVLKPRGALVFLYNSRVHDASQFMHDYDALVQRHSIDYKRIRHENLGPEVFSRLYGTADYGYATVENPQAVGHEQLIARARSSSYLPGHDDPRHADMLAELDAQFERHRQDDRVVFVYKTEIYWGFPSRTRDAA